MTPLAKKVFELFGKPELAAEREKNQTEEQPLQTSAKTPGEGSCTADGGTLPADYSAVTVWLAEHHPALWGNLRGLEEELTRIEQGTPVGMVPYQEKLAELLSLYQEASAEAKVDSVEIER